MKKSTSEKINKIIFENQQFENTLLRQHIRTVCNINLSLDAIAKRKKRILSTPLFTEKVLSVFNEPPQKIETTVEDLEKKILEKQFNALVADDLQEQGRKEVLHNLISKSLTKVNFKNIKYNPPSKKGINDEEEVVLVLSDLHFGKTTSKYNLDIALTKFNNIIDNALKIVNIHRNSYPINNLHILWTGDIVDGSAIYPNQPYHIDRHAAKQVFDSLPTVVSNLDKLSKNFKNITNYVIQGNHGRNGKFAHEAENWDNIYGKCLEVATSSLNNMKWIIPFDWKLIANINGTKILQYHGHQIKMTLNLPWYGITTRISRWALTEELGDFDVSVQGHFHVSSRLRWNNKIVYTNGTIVEGDQFALENLGLEASQAQWIFGVHPKQKVTWEYELRP